MKTLKMFSFLAAIPLLFFISGCNNTTPAGMPFDITDPDTFTSHRSGSGRRSGGGGGSSGGGSSGGGSSGGGGGSGNGNVTYVSTCTQDAYKMSDISNKLAASDYKGAADISGDYGLHQLAAAREREDFDEAARLIREFFTKCFTKQ